MYSNSMLVALCAIFSVAYVMADCPNSCSGHGTCGADNKCVCYPDYGDADCSIRSCPAGLNAGSGNIEQCSGRGQCDQKNGDCKCDTGYEGEACGRTSCPNECSQHGSCVGGAIRSCQCDFGYSGADCSSRLCPVGDDPLTTETYKGSGKAQQDEEQSVTVSLENALSVFKVDGDFVLTFHDAYGGAWTTRPVSLNDGSDNAADAKSLEDTIESLPNQAFPDVTVSTGTHDTTSKAYTITFNSNANSGDVPPVTCHIAGCNLDGCQPRYQGVRKTYAFSQTTAAGNKLKFHGDQGASTSITVAAATDMAVCSGKTITFKTAFTTDVAKQPFAGSKITITRGSASQTSTVADVDLLNKVLTLVDDVTVCTSTVASPDIVLAFETAAQSIVAAGVPTASNLGTAAGSVTSLGPQASFAVSNNVVTLAGTDFASTNLANNIAVGDTLVATDLFYSTDRNKALPVTAVTAKTITIGTTLTDVTAITTTTATNTVAVHKTSAWSPFLFANNGDRVTIGGSTNNNKKFTIVSVSPGKRSAQVSGNVYTETPGDSVALTATGSVAASPTEAKCVVAEVKKGTKESDVCSGRGSCDGSAGTCLCYAGYTGESCDQQVNEM